MEVRGRKTGATGVKKKNSKFVYVTKQNPFPTIDGFVQFLSAQ